MPMPVTIREASPSDAPSLAALLNRVVDEGGRTAIDVHFDADEFREWLITGEHCLGCLVAESRESLVGSQALERFHDDLSVGWADIATFVDRSARRPGVGRRLFDATLFHARTIHTTILRAVVTSTNTAAIGYDRVSGFTDLRNDRQGAVDEMSLFLTRPVPPAPAANRSASLPR